MKLRVLCAWSFVDAMATPCGRCLWFLKLTGGANDQNNIDTLSAAGKALIAIKDFISSLHKTNLCKSNPTPGNP